MNFFQRLLQLKSAEAVQYALDHLAPEQGPHNLKTDGEYVRVWLRSAYITDVRKWTTKCYAGAHARFELTDWKAGKREVLSVVAPDKTFEEMDPRHLDRLITVNQPLLGPVPFRGELSMDIGLFSIPSENLAKPYLSLLSDLTRTAGVAFLSQAAAFAEPLRRGAEAIFGSDRSELEIGLSRTDTEVRAGHWIVARVPKEKLPPGLRLDPNDYGLLDSNGQPVKGFPYMVIGIEGVGARDDYHSIPEIRAGWESVRLAAADATSADEVLNRFAQLRRAIGLSSELISADKKRIALTFARELADAGFDAGLPLAALESAQRSERRSLKSALDLLAPEPVVPPRAPRAAALEAAGALEAAATASAPPERISMEQLQQLVGDPSVPDSVLRRYFTVSPSLSQPFAPAVVIDPARVEVAPTITGLEGALGMGIANRMSRWRRQDRFNQRLANGDPAPVLVSEGDSWFQFPIYLEDVVDHLNARFNVWSVDAAGDTLENMVNGKPEFMKALNQHKGRVQAFIFSGGGNDILGSDQDGVSYLASIVKPFEAGRPVEWYLDHPAYFERMRYVEDAYRKLLSQVAAAHPKLPVICHGYDRAIPGGYPGDSRNPSWADRDEWLGKPLRSIGIVDPQLQQAIVGLIVDRFVQRLRGLCGGNHPGGTFPNAHLVDVRGVVDGRWADELHPQDEGYRAVAARFASVLGPLVKTGAASGSPGALESVSGCEDMHVDEAETTRPRRSLALEGNRPWRAARCLLTLRSQVNAMAPARSRASDGIVGDASHKTRDSDHNPWVEDGSHGVVTAIDITHDLAGGCDAGLLVDALLASKDPRIKYVIWNRRICSSTVQPWTWRPYTGKNPHTKHVHISVRPEKAMYDSEDAWNLGD